MDRFVKGALDGLLSATLVVLIAVNAGLIPLGSSTKTADAAFNACYGCNVAVPCTPTVGACTGAAGSFGVCLGWGLFCIDGLPKCPGTTPAGKCWNGTGC
jgi:hypothetical protein